MHQCARTQRLYNPVYSVPAILLFGVIFFSLPVVAKGNGKIMKQGPLKLVEEVMLAIVERAEKQTRRTKMGIKTAH